MQKSESPLLLDTHVWLWLFAGIPNTLQKKTISLINHAAEENQLFISAISAWEVSMLHTKKRIDIGVDCLNWVEHALNMPGIALVNLEPIIAISSNTLSGTFHGDPADRIIVATALQHDALIVTADKKILQYAKRGNVKAIAA